MRFATTARVALATICLLVVAPDATVSAHDEIESSVPAQGSQLDEPISEFLISFGAPVGNVELALVGPDDRDLPGTVTKLSDTTARLEFDKLTEEGEYFVRFLAEEDGHLIRGAIAFVYGSEQGTGAGTTTWVIFGLVATVILAGGLYFTVRRARQPDEDAVAV